MSYLVARMQKNKLGNLGGLQLHNERKTSNHSNKDIDVTKSHLNYSLINRDKKMSYKNEFVNYINQEKISKRAIRKDAVIVNEWIISSDSTFFENLPLSETKRFFEESVAFFKNRYGENNIRFAEVHMDERTPHMHLGVIPLREGKLTAKTIFNRVELKAIQEELPKFLKEKDFSIQRGEVGSERKNLTVPEYKKMKESMELNKEYSKIFEEHVYENAEKSNILDNKIKEQEDIVKELNSKILILETREANLTERVEGAPSSPYEWQNFFESKFKKSLLNDNMIIKKEDFKTLKSLSSQQVVNGYTLERIQKENHNLVDQLNSFKDTHNKELVKIKREKSNVERELTQVKNDFSRFVREATSFITKYLVIENVKNIKAAIDLMKEYAQISLNFKWPMLDSDNQEIKDTVRGLKKAEQESESNKNQEQNKGKGYGYGR